MLKALLVDLLATSLIMVCACTREAPTPVSTRTVTTSSSALPATLSPQPSKQTATATSSYTYRNGALGFEVALPASLRDVRAAACLPEESLEGSEVYFGSNIVIRVRDSSEQTAMMAADDFLTRLGATAEATLPVVVAGQEGLRVGYRLMPSGRFGTATFVPLERGLYTILFEARDMGQCGGLATPALYDAIVNGFRFLP